jgi:hypothetical protein
VGKFRLKIKAGRACPAALIVYFPETKKTTGASLEPARGFLSSIDSCSSTDFTPARQAKKAAIPKVEICKQPTLTIHPDTTLGRCFVVILGSKNPHGKQAKNLPLLFS